MRKLEKAKKSKIIVDANILMCGIEHSNQKAEYSFENMRECYLDHMFAYFEDIQVHEAVMLEVGDVREKYLTQFIGKNLTIVSEGNLYNSDPIYNEIFNSIARYDLFDYERKSLILKDNPSYNRGDVFTLAYAAYHKIPFCSSRDGSVMSAIRELNELEKVQLIGFEYCLLLGYLSLNNQNNALVKKRIKSLYKTYCEPEIKRGSLPKSFGEFLSKCSL
ncbi:MAG TPA: hypothetical protein VIO64_06190 [Pseudobacteroides sp.]|uniref:hypothetical protein n=1 Tax=Pseudobacteroides sp. TaxID=1968840 RepID=UPI002F91CF41